MKSFLLFSLLALQALVAVEIKNSGFEEVVDGKPVGWSIGDKISQVSGEDPAEGKFCFRIADTGKDIGSSTVSARFPVVAGENYYLRLKLFLESGEKHGLGVYLRLWDVDGKEMVKERESQVARPAMTPGKWVDTGCLFNIPDQAVQAAVWFHTFNSAIATVRVDDLAITQFKSEAGLRAGDWTGGELVALPDGSSAIRWRHIASPNLTLEFKEEQDWSEKGLVSFELHSPQATGSAFMLIFNSQNPETEGSDYYSYKITQDWEGKREFRLPLRELGGSRSPLGWDHIQSVNFTASGWGNSPHPEGVVLLSKWKVSGARRFGPDMDDAAFFAALDLDLPALSAVKDAVEKKDYQAAKKAFADHIRHRESPRWRIDWRKHPMRGVRVPKPEEDKDPNSWDYYSKFITLDWEGWKKFSFKKEDFPTRSFVEGKGWQGKQPIGWHWIQSIAFNASGWGLTPNPATVLHFDDIQLVGPNKRVTISDFESEEAVFSVLQLNSELAHSGNASGKWENLPVAKGVRTRSIPHDWTEFDRIEFWLHSRAASKDQIVLIIDSDAPKPNVKADKLVNKEFSFNFSNRAWPITFKDKIDWHANPTSGANRTHLWNESINRHFHFRTLSDAYWTTGREIYAETIAEHLLDWVRRNPRPLLSSGNRSAMTNCTWQTLTTGIRLEGVWPDTLYRCLGSPAFTDEVIVTLVKSYADQAEHLIKNPSGGNWLTEESMGVYTAGMLFPEYRRAKEWRRIAIERLNRQLDEDVYPDGMQMEVAAGYSNWVISSLTDLPRRAASVDRLDEIPGDYMQRLERAYNYHLYAMMPNGAIPGLNDSGPSNVLSRLLKAHKLFPQREDFLFGATKGTRGTRPGHLSQDFPYTGHYVMRSDWGADAVYALLDSGPYGYGHQHEDKLSFVLYAHGRQLLLDPGNFSYDRSPARRYVLGTHGHNTIMVDGQGQKRRGKRATYVWPKPWDTPVPRDNDTVWKSTPETDFVCGTYRDGYAKSIRVNHTRRMLFIKPDYFVILDTLQPEDDAEHSYSSLFHIDDTEAVLDAETLAVQTQTSDKANLALIPALQRGLRAQVVKGQKEPMQGWANHPWREVPTAIYTWEAKGVSHQATVVYPLKPGQECPVKKVGISPEKGSVGVAVHFADGGSTHCRFYLEKDAPIPFTMLKGGK